MKKLILLLTLLIFSVTVYSAETTEEVFAKILVLQKEINESNDPATIKAAKTKDMMILEFKNNYTLTKGKWYYGLYNLSPNADNQTFKIINRSYAKDKKSVFEKNFLLKGANPETFVVLFGKYSRDDKIVYYRSEKIPGADPVTFKGLNYFYAVDKSNAYSYGDKMAVADLSTFEVLNGKIAKDSKNIYVDGVAVTFDRDTFKALGESHSRDTNNVY